MTSAWILPPDGALVALPGRVLRAREFADVQHAHSVVEAAKARAQDILEQANNEKDQLQRQWRAAAVQDGQEQLTALLQSLDLQFSQFQSQLESSLGDFVLLCLKTLLHELGDHAALAQRIEAVVRSMLGELPLELYVAPGAADGVSAALLRSELAGKYPIKVLSDATLPNNDFMVVSQSHCADGRLSQWLNHLGTVVGESAQKLRDHPLGRSSQEERG
jgi:flagellar biosynthesis/type III secretory pathway protein FliH